MHDPSNTESLDWQSISPNWIGYKRVNMIFAWGTAFIVPIILSFILLPLAVGITVLLIFIALITWRFIIAAKMHRAWRYALGKDNLYIEKGLIWHSWTAIPYGRMQVVTVDTGPIQRLFGISKVTMVTAASAKDGSIEGLAPEVAQNLRQQLTTLSEVRPAGL